MESAGAGRSATILVAGDAGVGKSRLVAEFAAEAEAQGVLVLVGNCVELGEGELPTRRGASSAVSRAATTGSRTRSRPRWVAESSTTARSCGSRRRAMASRWATATGRGLHQICADRCICALPFAPLRRVPHRHSLLKRRRWRRYASCSTWPRPAATSRPRRSLEGTTRSGALGGLNLVGTDTMAGRVWNTSSQQPEQHAGHGPRLHVRHGGPRVLLPRPSAGSRPCASCSGGCYPASADR